MASILGAQELDKYVRMGYFRDVGEERFPRIPTVARLPAARCGKLSGYAELPSYPALQRRDVSSRTRLLQAIFPDCEDFADLAAAFEIAESAPRRTVNRRGNPFSVRK